MRHTISVLVDNKFGVLARISGLFSARGFNITSLAVGETDDLSISRMTIVVEGDDRTLEQIKKQLNKLIDVIKVVDFKDGEYIDRELVLVKVTLTEATRAAVLKAAEASGARIEKAGAASVSIEATGDQMRVKSLLEAMRPFGILEVVRTGRVAMGTGERVLRAEGKPEVNE